MIDVISGGDRRPDQQEMSVPGARYVARRAGTGDRPGEPRCTAVVLRWQRRGLAGGVPPGPAKPGTDSHADQPARLPRHGPARTRPNHIDHVTPAHSITNQPGPWLALVLIKKIPKRPGSGSPREPQVGNPGNDIPCLTKPRWELADDSQLCAGHQAAVYPHGRCAHEAFPRSPGRLRLHAQTSPRSARP